MTNGMLDVERARIFYKVRGAGPPLLVLQGGGGTADSSDGLAAELATDFTFVSYDRRGLLRSPCADPKAPLTISRHVDDAVALLDELGYPTVTVLASSLGALIGLELIVRFPTRVSRLVAHEPPALELLSPAGREELSAMRKEVLELALRAGQRAALRRLLVGMGIDSQDREDDCEPPPSSREQGRETPFLLAGESRAVDAFRLDFAALEGQAAKIDPAFGASSRECYPAACALELGRRLGRTPCEFPGGHNGYVLRPRAFARTLARLLATAARGPLLSGFITPGAPAPKTA